MDIIKAHATKNLCYVAARKMKLAGIVVHSTGANNPNLKRYVDCPAEVGGNAYGNHWNNPTPDGRKVCVHAFIGYDRNKKVRVAEILPLDICCWGVGSGSKGSYNYNPAYIQFEICEDGLRDKKYYRQAFDVAAEYCVYLCKQYGIAVDKIVGHNEAYALGYGSNHADPEHWMKRFGESMDDFRKRVREKLGISEEAASKEAFNVKETHEKPEKNQAKEKTEVQKKSQTREKTEDSSAKTSQVQKATAEKSSDKARKNSAKATKQSFKKGDLVSISKNATYYNGQTMPSWVKSQRWYVKETPKGDRVVIDKNEKGTNSICSPVNSKYLSVVRKAGCSLSCQKALG